MRLGLGLGIDKSRVLGGGFVGVFDEYSGGLFGISTRQVLSTYAGNNLTVRRSSDNATEAEGFTSNELDTGSLLSFIGANNGFTNIYNDQSSNSNDAAQSTAANQPQIVSSGSLITINSKAAHQFNGTTQSVLVWNNTTAPTDFQSLGSDLTIITRVQTGSNVSGTGFINQYTIAEIRQNVGTGSFPFSFGVDTDKLSIVISPSPYGTFREDFTSTANLSINTNYYFGITITGTTLKLFINGALDSTHTITTAAGNRTVGTTNSTFSIGVRSRDGGQADANYWNGKLNELLLFNTALSDANVISIMDNSTL